MSKMNETPKEFVERVKRDWPSTDKYNGWWQRQLSDSLEYVEQLETENKRLKEALEGLIKESHKNDRLVSRAAILRAEKALEGEEK